MIFVAALAYANQPITVTYKIVSNPLPPVDKCKCSKDEKHSNK